MAAYDEAIEQLCQAIEDWDFSPAFPTDYPNTSGVRVWEGWPWQQVGELEAPVSSGPQGELTEYIVTVNTLSAPDVATRLGSTYGAGQQAGTTRLGKRVDAHFLISSWADQRLLGMGAARKLAGQLAGCLLYNQNRLASVRHLRIVGTSEDAQRGSQLYAVHLTVCGDWVYSIDV